MNKRIKTARYALSLAAALLFAVMAVSCFNMAGPDLGGTGSVTISVGGNAVAASVRAAIPSEDTQEQLEYKITATSGELTSTLTLTGGAKAGIMTLSTGQWAIAAEAYLPGSAGSPTIHVGTGSTTATITAGDMTNATISLVFDNVDLAGVTVTGNDGNEYNGEWDKTEYTVVVPGSVTRVTILATPEVVDADISYSPEDGLVTNIPGSLTITVRAGAGHTAEYTVIVTLATISAASIGGLVAPETGAASAATGGITAGTGYTVQSLTWKKGSDNFTGDFAPLTDYTAEIVLKAEADYTFSGTITPTTNLPVETYPVSAVTINGSGAGNTLTFTVSFPTTTGGAAAIITAWVAGETIATSADGASPTITRTAGNATGASLTINVDPPATGNYDTITWTVDTESVTADSPPYTPTTAVSAYTFDATWKSDGVYNIGLSVTKDGNTYSTTITVTVRDFQ
jgi:hypothetical protein